MVYVRGTPRAPPGGLRPPGPPLFLSFDRDDLPTRHGFQLSRGKLKYRMGSSCGSPELFILQQVLINEGIYMPGVTNWRHTTDDKPGPLSHKIGIRFFNGLTGQLAQAALVHAVCATGNHENGFVGMLAFEYQ